MAETLTIPGLVDVHVHMRDPSTNEAENFETGTDAAAMGGYVVVADMPNNPGSLTWSVDAVEDKVTRVQRASRIGVVLHAGSQPESDNIGQLKGMYAAGANSTKFYGTKTTGNDNEYDPADFSEIADELRRIAPDRRIFLHSGAENLEDFLGLLAVDKKLPVHVCHINNPDDVDIVQRFKAREDATEVTSGVTPHHLLKNSMATRTEGVFAEMMPPLAHQDDSDKLMAQLAAGLIDIVETDHAPHSKDAKIAAEQTRIHDCHGGNCFGVPNIDFAFPLLAYQAAKGHIDMDRLVDAMSTQPARILGIKLAKKTEATFDMDLFRIDDEESMVRSGSEWTPFLGMMAMGRLRSLTTKGGRLIVGEGRLLGRDGKVLRSNDPNFEGKI